jgi:hypothetical protein
MNYNDHIPLFIQAINVTSSPRHLQIILWNTIGGATYHLPFCVSCKEFAGEPIQEPPYSLPVARAY